MGLYYVSFCFQDFYLILNIILEHVSHKLARDFISNPYFLSCEPRH